MLETEFWPDYLKTKGNMNIKLWDLQVWDFDCLHFAQYISISPHGIDCKQTWYKKIYCMDRVSWLKPLIMEQTKTKKPLLYLGNIINN